jgi:tRNA modification GTPase
LFNRLVEHERAIVTATPGTTRDLVSETVAIGGIPIKLVDTAGIRRALDEAESIGIRKSMEALADADLVLVVFDSSHPLAIEDKDLLGQVAGGRAIAVANKCDLVDHHVGTAAPGCPAAQSSADPRGDSLGGAEHLTGGRVQVRTSATTGEGISELRNEILRHVGGEANPQTESGFLTNLRHQERVRESITALGAATAAIDSKVPHEMLLLDLYNALRALDEITGATTTDDILNLIFSTFCIGK